MTKSNYIKTAEFCEQMSVKYTELASLNYEMDFLKKDLDSSKESLDILKQRFDVLDEENKLNKELLKSKSIYCQEIEGELEMVLENHRELESLNESQNQLLIDRLNNNLDSIYSSINISILLDHIDYIKDLSKDAAPFVFEEILEHLEMLVKLKELYDQGKEDRQNEYLHEF